MASSKIDRPLVLEAYRNAEKRILFLDYDGTLVPFSDLPDDSKLDEDVRGIIINLSLNLKNRVYIISGRDKGFLNNQFNGISVGLIAEHGFLIKEISGEWIQPILIDTNWKNDVIDLFHKISVTYPGSFIEQKEASIAYHYRTAGSDMESKIRFLIKKGFIKLKQQYHGLELLDGDKVMEIKPEFYNKGHTASSILHNGNFDFILAAGDDLTDERLFAELPANAFSIKMGLLPTNARYCISSQKKFIEFLFELQEVR